jgi:uncharacterized protein (UPF0276 family)
MPHRATDRPGEAPFLGVGVGLRPRHYPDIFADPRRETLAVDWFEAITENYLVPGGRPPRVLDALRRHFPVALHGVSLNIGSADPLDEAYVDRLVELAQRIDPVWVTDHLCWTSVGGQNLHDLLPLPLTEAALGHIADRVARVQDRLGRRIALENASSYVAFRGDEMHEWEFLAGVAERADCGILLDVNNVFVSAHNHGFEAETYLDAIPGDRVFQIHLGGPSEAGPLLIDTHDHPVRDEVWTLYERVIRRLGPVSTLIEWDDRIPPFAGLAAEAARVRAILERIAREQKEGRHGYEPHRAACLGAA